MTRLDTLIGRARPWWKDQPVALERVLADVQEATFDLAWYPAGGGVLSGHLPRWPFDRPPPELLTTLVLEGLLVEVHLGQSFPMLCPKVFPLDPLPPIDRWTQHCWHVNGDGSLCQLQSADAWDPSTSVVDVLRKAAGWRVEYALVQAGAAPAMSLSGMVSDDSLDALVTEAARIAADAVATHDEQVPS
jgi:hypothetical protein